MAQKETVDLNRYLIDKCALVHMAACEEWNHGPAADSWRDDDGNLCIQYADGSWWHYRAAEDGIEWW